MTASLPVHDSRDQEPTGTVTVAACQLAPTIGERTRNIDRMSQAVTVAADHDARLVVLPELASSGYAFTGVQEARRLAETRHGPTVSRLEQLARDRDAVIVAGLPELDDAGTLWNSAVLVDATGLRTVYRKAHLWDTEKAVFVPGDDPPPVVDTPVGRVGVVVCYDLEFPEWLRLAALAGAEIVCAPTNWPAETRPDGERPIEVVRVQAAASVNRFYVAVADRTGPERGVRWVGGSAIVKPDGFPAVSADPATGEQVLLASCSLTTAQDKRISPTNDVLADRRPELYGKLADGR